MKPQANQRRIFAGVGTTKTVGKKVCQEEDCCPPSPMEVSIIRSTKYYVS